VPRWHPSDSWSRYPIGLLPLSAKKLHIYPIWRSRYGSTWLVCQTRPELRIALNKQFCLQPSLECRQRWRRSDICRQTVPHASRGHQTRGLRVLTGASQARRVCSLIPSEDTAGRRGPPHTGGRWRGTTEPGRWGSGRREQLLPVCSRSADSSSASAAHEELSWNTRML